MKKGAYLHLAVKGGEFVETLSKSLIVLHSFQELSVLRIVATIFSDEFQQYQERRNFV